MKTKVLVNFIILLAIVIAILSSMVNYVAKSGNITNGFSRRFINNPLKLINSLYSKEPINFICGSTKSSIFFSGVDPRIILTADHKLNIKDRTKAKVNFTKGLLSAYEVIIDSPNVYYYAYNLSTIVKYNLNKHTLDTIKLEAPLFTRVIRISSTSSVIRAFDSTRSHQFFEKINNLTGKSLYSVDLIKKQTDAGFSTDGIFRYDSVSKRFLYVQYYQNKFYCLDTNLKLSYEGRTIDTTFNNIISTKQFDKNHGGSLMPSGSLSPINKECTVSKGKIFILSSKKADNERNDTFKNNSVVDMYSIKSGGYFGSFYIPNVGDKSVKYFNIIDSALIAIYDNEFVQVYKFTL